MGFLQGPMTTVNRLTEATPTRLPDSLSFVVPMSARDIDRPAAETVLNAAASLDPDSIIIPVRGPRSAVNTLASWVDETYESTTLLWCNGPHMRSLVDDHDLELQGKGGDLWLALGPATQNSEVVVCIDADVTSMTTGQLERLIAPLTGDVLAVKASYTRIEDNHLYGRLCRLLIRPLILAATATWDHPLLSYLAAFDYPLSGEIVLDAAVASDLRIPAGMGLELGTLGELYHRVDIDQLAQVDLGNHQHDHRSVDGDDGLAEIAPELTGTFYEVLREHMDDVDPDRLVGAYDEWADRLIDQYERDATINGLEYDVSAEREQVRQYSRAVRKPAQIQWMPAWSSIDLTPESVRTAGVPSELTRAD